MTDEVVVGDLNSNKLGSGARKNANKVPLDLIPVETLRSIWALQYNLAAYPDLRDSLRSLTSWQEGNTLSIYSALNDVVQYRDEACRVFEFGAQKYARWNWAKGMPWRVPLGCALRHAEAILKGEEHDTDSGLLHGGHYYCNLVMLAYYWHAYPEGDDRPIFEGA